MAKTIGNVAEENKSAFFRIEDKYGEIEFVGFARLIPHNLFSHYCSSVFCENNPTKIGGVEGCEYVFVIDRLFDYEGIL